MINVQAAGAVNRDQIAALVREAADAAGRGDTDDSWSWRVTGAVIELRAALPPVHDIRNRTLLLVSGAALLNLRLLIRGLGVHPAVRLFPDPGRPDLIATVRLEGPRPVTDQDRALVAGVLSGTPDRPAGGPAAVGVPLISALRRSARTEQAWLAVQPLSALPPPAAVSQNGSAAGPGGTALIVGTVLDGPGARLQAGQAAQRVIATAAALGVPVTAVPGVLRSEAHREAVRELIGGGVWPQTVLHLSAGLQEPPAQQQVIPA